MLVELSLGRPGPALEGFGGVAGVPRAISSRGKIAAHPAGRQSVVVVAFPRVALIFGEVAGKRM